MQLEVGKLPQMIREWQAYMIALVDEDGTRRPVAAVNAPNTWSNRRELAVLLSRAHAMQGVLLHLLAELEVDDDGTRWQDEVRMIREELALGGWREAKAKGQDHETDTATRLHSGIGDQSGQADAAPGADVCGGREAE